VNDWAIGKRMVEEMILDQVLDSFPTITGRTVTDEWNDAAVQVEGSPDFIIGIDGKAFGLELTEICGVGDAWGYVDEAYRLASRKSESYSRRQIFQFPIGLIMHSERPPLCSTLRISSRMRPGTTTSKNLALPRYGQSISQTNTTVQGIPFGAPTSSVSSRRNGSAFTGSVSATGNPTDEPARSDHSSVLAP
jgi:hypothetical protein